MDVINLSKLLINDAIEEDFNIENMFLFKSSSNLQENALLNNSSSSP